jgi:electron transport complex protein RnfC
MGGEKQLVYALTGEEVPRDGIPAEIGVVTQNVATAAAIYQAVTHGRPLLSRVITVTGSGVARPGNYEVRLGTPIRDLLAACGGPDDDTVAVIMGGSMMGFPIRDVQAPVIKTTNCLIAAHAAEVGAEPRAMPCIRCGACQTACPVDLLPQQLYWYARAKDMVRVQEYNLFDCIECGCCAYVCPSRIPLVSFYRYAKTEIAAQERDRQRADVARRRHAQHDQRIAREKAEREARRLEKKAALDTAGQGKTGSAAVDQAVARKQQGAVSAPGGDQE